MKIKLKFFAIFHEMFARREKTIALSEGATVIDILKRLESENPRFAEYYDNMQIAVNWEYAEKDTPLKNGDEVAFIPPVSGG